MLINKKQRTIIIIGLGIILLMGVIPPGNAHFRSPASPALKGRWVMGLYSTRPLRLRLLRAKNLTSELMSNPSYWNVRLDITRLFFNGLWSR